jgi:hypothetical protein
MRREIFMRASFVTVGAMAACLLVTACDQNSSSKSNDVTVSGHDGNLTISANGQKFTMKAGDGKNGNFTMSGDNGHFTMKASDGKQNVEINASGNTTNLKLPDFVAIYPGAKVQSTVIDAGASGGGGTFTFETKDSPASVIAYYKQRSESEGLAQALNMSTGTTTMFSANSDKGKRAIQVVAASSGSGARVQVNWSGGD